MLNLKAYSTKEVQLKQLLSNEFPVYKDVKYIINKIFEFTRKKMLIALDGKDLFDYINNKDAVTIFLKHFTSIECNEIPFSFLQENKETILTLFIDQENQGDKRLAWQYLLSLSFRDLVYDSWELADMSYLKDINDNVFKLKLLDVNTDFNSTAKTKLATYHFETFPLTKEDKTIFFSKFKESCLEDNYLITELRKKLNTFELNFEIERYCFHFHSWQRTDILKFKKNEMLKARKDFLKKLEEKIIKE